MKTKNFIIILLTLFCFSSCEISDNAKANEFKIIDIHEHIQSMDKAQVLLDSMDKFGIEKTVLLPSSIETLTSNGRNSFTQHDKNIDEILKITEKYPDRFVPFCTINPLDSNALEKLMNCHERGGMGLKLYNGHSSFYKIFNISLDSQRMFPIYEYAQKNNLPVIFHVNIYEYMNEFEKVLKRFPDLVVDVPHFMVSSKNLNEVARLFDLYPNLYTDISFGGEPFLVEGLKRISDNPNKYRDFFEDYSDRIMFGTDMVISDTDIKNSAFIEATYKCYMDMLLKEKYNCSRSVEFTEELQGLSLDNKILIKILYENPKRFLNINK